MIQLILCPWLRKGVLKNGILLDNRQPSQMNPQGLFAGPVSTLEMLNVDLR